MSEVINAPAQGTKEWLEWRKKGITATEASLIMFPSKWGSPISVYTDKLGLTSRDDSDRDGYMEWGHRIEDLLVNKFMEEHQDFTQCEQGKLYENGWAKCSLDAQCLDNNGEPIIIECKTGQDENKWTPIPDKYYAQVQWQMYVTGIRKAYFSVLIRGHLWFEREVEYNEVFVERMLERCTIVWNSINSKTPPTSLGFYAADTDAIKAIAGKVSSKGNAVDIDTESIIKYYSLKEKAERATEELKSFTNELMYKLVDSSKLLYQGKTFASWVVRKGSETVNKDKVKREYPDIYEKVKTQGSSSRYVRYSTKPSGLSFGDDSSNK